jgi:Tol biopolymer transport system component
VRETAHFDIYFYPGEEAGVDLAARMAERWNARLSRLFDHRLSSRQPLILYASAAHFQQTNVVGGELGEGTGGVTESLRRRMVLPLAGPLADTDHVIGHELVHAFQYDIAAERSRQRQRASGIEALPLWFIEGMAEYLSIGPESPLTSMWMRDAIIAGRLPATDRLDDPRYFPYRWGHAWWAFVAARWGDAAVASLLDDAVTSGDYKSAISSVLGITHEALTTEWHTELTNQHGRTRGQPIAPGLRAITPAPREPGSEMHVSPALSPDGRRIAYLSSRDLFSIDLYVADVATVEVTKRLTQSSSDPHVDSLQFIASAGAWDPEGQFLVTAVQAGGRSELQIIDTRNGNRTRTQPLESVDGAINPAWSPDGRFIAFTGFVGGLTDLFVLDLETGALSRLTDDAFAELQPAWAPDGRRIALATDRFTTTLEAPAPGRFQLALIDLQDRAVRQVAGAPGKQINPQWSPDGSWLYYVGDPDGISNVYRVPSAGGASERVTSVSTGVAGITESSPALSVGKAQLAVVVFENVLGERYRFEVSPMVGSLQYAGVVADYRRYWMPLRFYTIAARVLHSGRYGGDAEDPRLFPQYLGYPSLVRGYDVGTFEAVDCPETVTNTCDAFGRLVGSRMLVANLELRIPLLRLFGQTSRPYGPVPVEVAALRTPASRGRGVNRRISSVVPASRSAVQVWRCASTCSGSQWCS